MQMDASEKGPAESPHEQAAAAAAAAAATAGMAAGCGLPYTSSPERQKHRATTFIQPHDSSGVFNVE